MNYDENKIAYTIIVGLIFIGFWGVFIFLPFLLVFVILLGAIALMLSAADKVFESYDKHVKPKVDEFMERED